MAIVFVKKNLPIFKLLFALGVNVFTLAGIIIWKWSFFVVIYFYWFEEVIRILFKLIENRIAYHKGWFPSQKAYWLAQNLTRQRLFPMFVYFVFIIVIVGFVVSFQHTDEFIVNVRTIFFKNPEFNIDVVLAILSQLGLLYLLFRKHDEHATHTHVQKIEKNTRELGAFSSEAIVLHLSIIFGTIAYFVFNSDKLPVGKIDIGEVGKFAFPIVFALIQVVAQIINFARNKKIVKSS